MAKQENEGGKSLKLNIGDSQLELPMDSAGNVTMPDELKQIIAAGMSVLSQGNKPAGSQEASEANDVTNAFRGLPMSELIGAPMYAAAEEQTLKTFLDIYASGRESDILTALSPFYTSADKSRK